MLSLLIVSAFVASVVAIPAGPPHPAPGYHAAPVHYEPRPYHYEYGVTDEYHGVNFGEVKDSDGKADHGSYHVLLPDGRIQTVTYTADHHNGYIAEVTYSGTAQYPEAKPYHPAPKAYKPAPAPVYKAAPSPAYRPAPKLVYKPAPAKAAPAPAKAAPAPAPAPAKEE